MSPTLQEGDVVVAMKTGSVHQGELAAFYFNNKILVKRVIAGPGDQVDIDDAGNVTVNGRALDEPYLTSRSKGNTTDLTYPYQVPRGRYFLMGDHRETSMDSRIHKLDVSARIGWQAEFSCGCGRSDDLDW